MSFEDEGSVEFAGTKSCSTPLTISNARGHFCRGFVMRFIIGMICGVALTIGVAWVIDHSSDSVQEAKLVNWVQVEKSFSEARQNVMIGWRKLTG
jgi:NhaP-type Na+/H+ or K+/H+ antiporter